MPRQCLFCDNPADSREHIWSAWIIENKEKVGWGPIRHSISGSREKIIDNAELRVRTVCTTCNNGWMSALEVENKTLIGALMHDISTPVDGEQQEALARWTLKTAIVLDSVRRRRFYERVENTALHYNSTIPERVKIWIGRCSVSSLGAFGTDLRIDLPDAPGVAKAAATTIVVGHLAIQILSIHVLPEHLGRSESDLQSISLVQPKPGKWDTMLTQTWPIGTRPVTWPPPQTFTGSGEHSIARLMDRWRLGSKAA